MKNLIKQLAVFIVLLGSVVRADPAQDVVEAEGEEAVAATQPAVTAPAGAVKPTIITEKFEIGPPFVLYQEDGRIKLLLEKDGPGYDFTQLPKLLDWEGSLSHFEIRNESDLLKLYWHMDIAGPGWLNVTIEQKKDGSLHVKSEITGRPPFDRVFTKDYKSYHDLEVAQNDDIAHDVRMCIRGIDLPGILSKPILQSLLFDKPMHLTDDEIYRVWTTMISG